ncbi:hypothetical protein ACH5AO_34085 [Streptomyces sp. NPDC018964]
MPPAAVGHRAKRTEEHAEGICPFVHQCRPPLSTRTVDHLAGPLRHV